MFHCTAGEVSFYQLAIIHCTAGDVSLHQLAARHCTSWRRITAVADWPSRQSWICGWVVIAVVAMLVVLAFVTGGRHAVVVIMAVVAAMDVIVVVVAVGSVVAVMAVIAITAIMCATAHIALVVTD